VTPGRRSGCLWIWGSSEEPTACHDSLYGRASELHQRLLVDINYVGGELKVALTEWGHESIRLNSWNSWYIGHESIRLNYWCIGHEPIRLNQESKSKTPGGSAPFSSHIRLETRINENSFVNDKTRRVPLEALLQKNDSPKEHRRQLVVQHRRLDGNIPPKIGAPADKF
jgi:hypothetical protein